MNVKEMNIVAETTLASTVTTATITTSVTNPTGIITQVASKEYLKILELTEYCRIAQSTTKECETKIQALVSSKNEATKLKMEYLTRNKINVINYESLLQARNKLHQYKCELKSSYVEIEKARKSKQLKYEKLVSSYEANWQKTQEEYTSNPLVRELYDIRQTIATIEKNIELQEKLYASTKTQNSELNRTVREKFLNKVLEFSKAMIEYRKFLISRETERKKHEIENSQKQQESGHIKFFKSLVPAFAKDASCSKEGGSNFPCIDVSVFDKLTVPTENLEIQNDEEELFHLIQNQNVQMEDDNGDQESTEMFLNDYHQTDDQGKSKTQAHAETGVKQNLAKGEREENESQYFRAQALENSCQRGAQRTTPGSSGHVVENLNGPENKKFKENPPPSSEILVENQEKINSEDNMENSKQIEGEKSFSEASYDNENGYLKDNFEYISTKTHSMASEDMPLSAANESFGSPRKVLKVEQTNIFKLQEDQEKDEPKSFGNFFGITSEKNSSKPSIFKLF